MRALEPTAPGTRGSEPRAPWEAAVEQELRARERAALTRRLREVEGTGPWVEAGGRRLVNLSSNDYLGLAAHPALAEAAARAARRGAGATASRLVVGHDRATGELEERLAAWQGAEAALVLGSGYLANLGVLQALAGAGDAICSDERNHASIVDGCRLSRAEVRVYRHGDLDHLDALLARPARRKLVVSDSVFSMDGDVAPLAGLVELKERHGAALVLDEAHAGGVLGPEGTGLAHALGLAEAVDVHVGTFSKAFGVYGAFVTAREPWIRLLVGACRTLIFTTGLPPAVIGAAGAALELVRAADERRAALAANAARFRARLQAAGLDTAGSETQIVPALLGESARALAVAAALEERGVLAVGIRPPTVPPGTARIRCSLMATHEPAALDAAAAAVAAAAAA